MTTLNNVSSLDSNNNKIKPTTMNSNKPCNNNKNQQKNNHSNLEYRFTIENPKEE